MSRISTKVDNNNSNETSSIMSPALTNDHCQDVDPNDISPKVETAKDIQRISQLLHHKGVWKKSEASTNGIPIKFYQTPNFNSDVILPKENLCQSSINSDEDDPSKLLSATEHSSPHTLLHKSNGVTQELKSNPSETDVVVQSTPPDHASDDAAVPDTSASECHEQVAVPSTDQLGTRLKQLEYRSLCQQRKINHLQSMLAARQMRQQLMLLVEHQHKILYDQRQQQQCPSNLGKRQQLQAANSVAAVAMDLHTSSAGQLSSLSTSALVDLVQRMQSKTSSSSLGLKASTSGKQQQQQAVTMRSSDKSQLKRAAGIMNRCLTTIQQDIDSDATASSSGGESDSDTDDLMTVPHRSAASEATGLVDGSDACVDSTSTSLRKKVCWRWAKDRALVISRWTWLQAQVSDLEYKIRQLGELHKQLRSAKSAALIPFPNAHQGAEDPSLRAARCFPLPSIPNRHKFVHVSEAPSMSAKARKEVMVRCQCGLQQQLQQPLSKRHCALCAGHHNYFKPTDLHCYPRNERLGQVSPGFHPVLSFSRDASPCIEIEEVMNDTNKKHKSSTLFTSGLPKKLLKRKKKKMKDLDQQMLSASTQATDSEVGGKYKKKKKLLKRQLERGTEKPSVLDEFNGDLKPKKRKYTRRKPLAGNNVGRPRVNSARCSDDGMSDSENCLSLSVSGGDSHKGNTSSSHKRSAQSYDIDDIVIPYHIVASTRVEKLQYKEIDTPRWREFVLDDSRDVPSQIQSRASSVSVPSTPQTPAAAVIADPVVDDLSQASGADERKDVSNDDGSRSQPSSSLPAAPDSSGDITFHLPSVTSNKSSTNSLAELEMDEDVSDEKYIERHSKQEDKEKQRYLNFVSGTGSNRRRTTSIASMPTTPCTPLGNKLPASDFAMAAANAPSETPRRGRPALSHANSIPLSASHDSQLLRDELLAGSGGGALGRKRSNSIAAGRVKRDVSSDLQEPITVQPWSSRTFPLEGNDLMALDPDWRPKDTEALSTIAVTTAAITEDQQASDQWKVIDVRDETEDTDNKGPLVIKLTKTAMS